MPDSPTDQVTSPDADVVYHLPDPNEVEEIWAQTLIDAGFHTQNRSGIQIYEPKLLQKAVLQVMEDEHVVTNSKDLAARAVTKSELYAEVLPNGPGVQMLAETPEAAEAQIKLMNTIWSITNTGISGYVQKNTGRTDMVLCEAAVPRTHVSEETGRREPTAPQARFLTADHQLILRHYTAPAGAKFAGQARQLEKKLAMVTTRQPEITVNVARQMAAVVKQALAALPHADVKQALALTASALTDNGDEAASA